MLGQSADTAAEAQNQLVGLIDLLALAAVTGIKAGLAVKHMPNIALEKHNIVQHIQRKTTKLSNLSLMLC